MAEFAWRLMADEEPPEGSGEYVVRGRDGSLNVTQGYGRYKGQRMFIRHDYEYVYIWAADVYAWAEIPPVKTSGQGVTMSEGSQCDGCREPIGIPHGISIEDYVAPFDVDCIDDAVMQYFAAVIKMPPNLSRISLARSWYVHQIIAYGQREYRRGYEDGKRVARREIDANQTG